MNRVHYTYYKCHVPNIKICTYLHLRITTGTLVLIILFKKAEMKINCMKDIKVDAYKASFDLIKNGCHRPSGLGGSDCCDQ